MRPERPKFNLRAADLVSFTTLGAGVASMAFSIDGGTRLAAVLILIGYVLDGIDGELARRLGGTSEFGTQLDSLIDVVHFGAAASVLISQHLKAGPIGGWPVWVMLAGYMFAASYRLARYNLTASLNNKHETLGLTISTGGAFLAIAVLADLASQRQLIPGWAFLLLLAAVSLLMISRIRYPDLRGLPRYRAALAATLAAGGLAAIWLPVEFGMLLIWTIYILFGTIRAGARALSPRAPALDAGQESIDQRSSA